MNSSSHHGHEHEHQAPKGDVTFEFDGIRYRVSAEAATNAGLVGNTDRIVLPSGQLILLHPHEGMKEPHVHQDNANTASEIEKKGGKIWRAEQV